MYRLGTFGTNLSYSGGEMGQPSGYVEALGMNLGEAVANASCDNILHEGVTDVAREPAPIHAIEAASIDVGSRVVLEALDALDPGQAAGMLFRSEIVIVLQRVYAKIGGAHSSEAGQKIHGEFQTGRPRAGAAS